MIAPKLFGWPPRSAVYAAVLTQTLLLQPTPAEAQRWSYHWSQSVSTIYVVPVLPPAPVESRTYSTDGVYRESPAEAERRLLDIEHCRGHGYVLYTLPENRSRADAAARRCGGRFR